jgi:hypothetical protein
LAKPGLLARAPQLPRPDPRPASAALSARQKARITEIDRGGIATAAEREQAQSWLSQYSILLDLIESKQIL